MTVSRPEGHPTPPTPDMIFLVASCMNHDAFHTETVGDREEVVIYTGLSVKTGQLDWMEDY